MRTLINTFAPSAYLGLRDGPWGMGDVTQTSPKSEWQITEFGYVYNVTLTALQQLQDNKSVDPDADFLLEAVSIGSSTGIFEFRYSDSRLYWTSDARIASAIYVAQDPYPTAPPLVIPAGGRIGIDIADTSNAGNTIQIIFRGAKRYQNR